MAMAFVMLSWGIAGIAIFFYGDLWAENRTLRNALAACKQEAARLQRQVEDREFTSIA